MTQERARFTLLEPGRIATYSGHKLRARAAAGLGEDLSEARMMSRRMRELARTQPEGARPDPHVITPEDVTSGLGVPLAVEQKIQAIVRDSISPSEGQKGIAAKRFASARSRLVDFMRRSHEVDSDARAEVMRRATHYWRKNFRVDYGRSPEMRIGKALVIPAQLLLMKAPKVGGPGVSPTGRVSMHPVVHDAASGKVGHKYIAKKPDGHGGWLYKYPGDTEFRPGAGIEEGHTKAPEGAHLAAHESGFKPSVEADETGGQKLHFGEDVHAHVPANADREHHRVEHAKHGAAYKQAMGEGNEEKAKAHLKAYQLHAELHNRQLRAERKAAQNGMAPPGAVPADMASAADGKQPKGAAAGPPGAAKAGPPGAKAGPGGSGGGTMPAAPGGAGPRPPTQAGRPPAGGASPMGAGSPQQPGMGMGGGEPPQGYAARTPPGADVGQYRQHLQAASDAMANLTSTHAHIADLDARMKAIQSGKEKMDPRMRKHQLAQLAAEKAQAELDRFQHEDAHDGAMQQLKSIHTTLMKEKLRNHPVVKMIDGLLKLMSSFASKMGHGDKPEEGGAEGESPESPKAEGDKAPEAKPAAMGEKHLSRRAPEAALKPKPVGEKPAASPADLERQRAGTAPTMAAPSKVEPAGADWLAADRAKRDATEKQASAAGDVWKQRQKAQGKDTQAIIREQLQSGTPGVAASKERGTVASRGTVATGKRAKKSATESDLSDLRKAMRLAESSMLHIRKHALDGHMLVFTPPTTRRLRLEW